MRNTPTSVGKTCHVLSCPMVMEKHPHERGEDLAAVKVEQGGVGNTPTSVGKTTGDTFPTPAHGKHPHERGEDG